MPLPGEPVDDIAAVVPEGIEVRAHDSSLRDIRTLEEQERDRRERLLASGKFAPPSEVEHARDEAKAFQEGMRRASIEGSENDAMKVVARGVVRDNEEVERRERTGSKQTVDAQLEKAFDQANAFRVGMRDVDEGSNHASAVARRALAREAEEDERNRRTLDPESSSIANKNMSTVAGMVRKELSGDHTTDTADALEVARKERVKAQEEMERDARVSNSAAQKAHAAEEARAFQKGLAMGEGGTIAKEM
ncbi:hypothetical protein HDU85_007556 [Gaertneriomyces sp. JEL0708]|nr:hypothetical protein HDU85_007556 [Gaertneriomyces sp. JEL0708]